jgi:GntR family transcriptional regulator
MPSKNLRRACRILYNRAHQYKCDEDAVLLQALEFHPDKTIASQIEFAILLEIASGKVAVGGRLESVRALAKINSVNPLTIAKVYGNLKKKGFVDSEAGRGFSVAEGADTKSRTVVKGSMERRMRELRKESEQTGIVLA